MIYRDMLSRKLVEGLGVSIDLLAQLWVPEQVSIHISCVFPGSLEIPIFDDDGLVTEWTLQP